MRQFVTNSEEETEALGARLGAMLRGPVVVAFFGGLGMGKTAFTRGLAQGMGIDAEVSSPTFALVHEYHGGGKTLYHFDMYRVESWDDLYATGFFDFYETGGVPAVEWSENIENALPDNTVRVEISRGDNENQRIITMEGSGSYADFSC
jgi:tRNA threonylcarbamoyladenosine biosynthesis protein TsaE